MRDTPSRRASPPAPCFLQPPSPDRLGIGFGRWLRPHLFVAVRTYERAGALPHAPIPLRTRPDQSVVVQLRAPTLARSLIL